VRFWKYRTNKRNIHRRNKSCWDEKWSSTLASESCS